MAKIMKSYLNAYDKAKTTSYFVEVPDEDYYTTKIRAVKGELC